MKKYLKWESSVSEIIMLRKPNKKQAFLLVEGISDTKFFSNIINKEFCNIKCIYGKENVINATNQLNKLNVKGVIAIVDSDFDNILDNSYEAENILVTDTHDIETLILKTSSIEKFLNEYGDYEKIVSKEGVWGISLLDKVISVASVMGYLKLISIKNSQNLNFQELAYDKFIDKNIDINIEQYIIQVLYNSALKANEKSSFFDKMTKEMNNNYDGWQISCGHDITEILSLVLSKEFGDESFGNDGAKYLSSTRVEASLRLSYNYIEFNNTELYKKMYYWQKKNITWNILERGEVENAS